MKMLKDPHLYDRAGTTGFQRQDFGLLLAREEIERFLFACCS